MKNRPEDIDLHGIPDEGLNIFDAIDSGNITDESVADELVVHGLLRDRALRDAKRDERRIRDVMSAIDSLEQDSLGDSVVLAQPDSSQTKSPYQVTNTVNAKSRRIGIASLAAALAAVLLLMFTLGRNDRASAAMLSLEKMIEVAKQRVDRSYRISLVEEYARDKRPRDLSQEAWNREAPERIDGATIHVRGANEYVMIVLLKTGVTRTSGCDGQVSWSFRENGPVHVSTELNRFRGGMPGNQQDMPFLNIHANLSQLKIGFDVELADEQENGSDGTLLSRLTCVRKSNVRGLKQVDVWFDAKDGTVHKMLLDGLPRGRGGPKSVMLELVDQSVFAPDFFSHNAHHDPGKRIKFEDKRP